MGVVYMAEQSEPVERRVALKIIKPGMDTRQVIGRFEGERQALGMMSGLTLWVRHLVGLMEDVVLRDAAGRLARYLLDSQVGDDGLVELPTLKRHLASHLNLTSETFSRTLRRLIDAGLFDQPPPRGLGAPGNPPPAEPNRPETHRPNQVRRNTRAVQTNERIVPVK